VTAAPVPYDRAKALQNLEDSEDLLREIAGIFIADYRSDLDAMRIALEVGDADTLFRLAHTLKSSLASFCAQKAFDATSVLVKKARTGDLDADQLAVVDALTEEVVAALRAELT
jgi:two-component system, sensor histidine kinase and response regulator